MIAYFIIGVLTVLMIAQNVFWAKIVLSLTNRVMSRNYAEVRQAEAKPTLVKPQDEVEIYDPVAENQARELNSLLGMA